MQRCRTEVDVFVVEVVVGTLVILVLAVLLASLGGDGLPDDADSRDAGVPDGRLMTSTDIARLRLRIGLRGYRMDDVDHALDAARAALEAAEARGKDRA